MKCKFNKRTGLLFSQPRTANDLTVHLAARGIRRHELYRGKAGKNSGQPKDTDSVRCAWLDDRGLTIAEVHFYELPSGKFGGTGKRLPDPLVLVHDGVAYEREKEPMPKEGSPFRYDGYLYWTVKLRRWVRCLVLSR